MKPISRHQLFFLLALGLIAAGAMAALLYSTPQGLGLSDDSIAYIAGARSIVAGNGYREAWLASNQPVTHFPPGFSSALALIGLSGLDPLRGTRFLNSLLFGANAFLLGILGWRMTKSKIAGILLALLFGVNASLFNVHAVAMSEPLYIFFSLAAFLTFSEYFIAQKNIWLVLTACFVSFAYLTRYAGLALLLTFLVSLVLLHETWKKRLQSAMIFMGASLPFLLGWGIRNKIVADNATNRILVYHPISAENIQTGIHNFSEFLVPVEVWRRALIKVPNFFVVVLSLLALILLAWVVYKGFRKFLQPATERPELLSFTNGLYVFAYLSSIVSTMLLFDASTKFKLRILSPVYVSLLVLLVLVGCWLWEKRSVFARALTVVFATLILSLSIYDTTGLVTKLHKGGQGYASFQWYDSQAMDFLRGLPKNISIYTNQPGPVYLYAGRPSYVLPDLFDPVTRLPREGYDQGVKSLQADVLSGKAVLALFKFGAESEDIQSIYIQLSDGLFLVHDTHGDKIYAGHP
jgi:Dolichyl-phosphate-mannose-protein mannosyltransferase